MKDVEKKKNRLLNNFCPFVRSLTLTINSQTESLSQLNFQSRMETMILCIIEIV